MDFFKFFLNLYGGSTVSLYSAGLYHVHQAPIRSRSITDLRIVFSRQHRLHRTSPRMIWPFIQIVYTSLAPRHPWLKNAAHCVCRNLRRGRAAHQRLDAVVYRHGGRWLPILRVHALFWLEYFPFISNGH